MSTIYADNYPVQSLVEKKKQQWAREREELAGLHENIPWGSRDSLQLYDKPHIRTRYVAKYQKENDYLRRDSISTPPRRQSLPPLYKNQNFTYTSNEKLDKEMGGETSGYGSDNPNQIPEYFPPAVWNHTTITETHNMGYESSASSSREDRPKWGDRGVHIGKFWEPKEVDSFSCKTNSDTPGWVKRGLERDTELVVSNTSPAESPEQDYGERPCTGSSASHPNRSYIRGQNVPVEPTELAERERRRQIALAHQEAVREQLQERENKRKIEKQRRLQEEYEEEQRIARETEQERQRQEREHRLKDEKLERERRRKEAIREAIEIAEKEAKEQKQKMLRQNLININENVAIVEKLKNDDVNEKEKKQQNNYEFKRDFDHVENSDTVKSDFIMESTSRTLPIADCESKNLVNKTHYAQNNNSIMLQNNNNSKYMNNNMSNGVLPNNSTLDSSFNINNNNNNGLQSNTIGLQSNSIGLQCNNNGLQNNTGDNISISNNNNTSVSSNSSSGNSNHFNNNYPIHYISNNGNMVNNPMAMNLSQSLPTENVALMLQNPLDMYQSMQFAILMPQMNTTALPMPVSLTDRSLTSTARTENRILTPTQYRNNKQVCDSSTQTDLAEFSKQDDTKYVREKLSNIEISYETRGSRKDRRSRSELRSESVEDRPKWGVNRPPTRYMKQSEKDPLYQRRKLRQKIKQIKVYDIDNHSSDDSQASPRTYRKKGYSEKRQSRALWRKNEHMFAENVHVYQRELVPIETDKDHIYFKTKSHQCCCRCQKEKENYVDHVKVVDILKIDHNSPRECMQYKNEATEDSNRLPECNNTPSLDSGGAVLEKLTSLHQGLMLKQEQWDNPPRHSFIYSPSRNP